MAGGVAVSDDPVSAFDDWFDGYVHIDHLDGIAISASKDAFNAALYLAADIAIQEVGSRMCESTGRRIAEAIRKEINHDS
jgi:hypothetical protein